jgi:hypothetical protein
MNLFSIVFNSKNEKIAKAYEAYLDAKGTLIDLLHEEGIEVVAVENTASGN